MATESGKGPQYKSANSSQGTAPAGPAGKKKKSILEGDDPKDDEDPLLQLAKSLQQWAYKNQDLLGIGKFAEDKASQAFNKVTDIYNNPEQFKQDSLDKIKGMMNSASNFLDSVKGYFAKDNLDLIENNEFDFSDEDIADMQTNNSNDDSGFRFSDDYFDDNQTNNSLDTSSTADLLGEYNFSDDFFSDSDSDSASASNDSSSADLLGEFNFSDDYFESASSHNEGISSSFSSESSSSLSSESSADSGPSVAPAA